jgi:deoxyribonuclease-1
MRIVHFLPFALLGLMACQAGPLNSLAPVRPWVQTQARSGDWYQRLSPELQRYYAPAQGKQGQALFQTLHQIVNQAQVLDYGTATAYLYTVADRVQQGKTTFIRDAYSNLLIAGDGPSGHKYKEIGDANGDGKKGDAINCEHTWPQSFFDKQGAMRTDMHHLFPTLSTPNSQRGSHPFGIASEGKVTYATTSGSRLIQRPDRRYVFEPHTGQKGNSARALLYFFLRYHNQPIHQNDYPGADFFAHRLPLFQSWMQQDPIDTQEQQRHELIAQRQGNRNPFIDIPELVTLIGPEILIQREQGHG